jgi:hypothetical protein
MRAVRLAAPPLAVLALAVLAWVRLDSTTRGTLWAEDGRDFLAGAQAGVPVVAPYQGYLHVLPRTIATLVTAFVPVEDWAIAMSAASVIVVAAVGVLIYTVSASLGLFRVTRAALAGITVLAPAVPSELLGNTANLHWFLLWAGPWLFLARPRSRLTSVLLGIVALIAAATEIQLLVFAPLLLWRWRDRRRLPIAVGALVGLAAQVTVTLTFPRARYTEGYPDALTTVDGLLLHVAGAAWTSPARPLLEAIAAHGWTVAWLWLLPFVVVGALVIVFSRRLRGLVVALLASAVVIFVAGFVLNLGSEYDLAGLRGDELLQVRNLRHGVVPSMLLLAVLVIGMDVAWRRAVDGRGARRVLSAVAAGMLAIALVTAAIASFDFTGKSARSGGPEWAQSVRHAARECAAGADAHEVSVKTAPAGATWQLTVSCARLTKS